MLLTVWFVDLLICRCCSGLLNCLLGLDFGCDITLCVVLATGWLFVHDWLVGLKGWFNSGAWVIAYVVLLLELVIWVYCGFSCCFDCIYLIFGGFIGLLCVFA